MKFKELLNTNSNILNDIYIYYADEDWEEGTPSVKRSDISRLAWEVLDTHVAQWEVDRESILHVLLSE